MHAVAGPGVGLRVQLRQLSKHGLLGCSDAIRWISLLSQLTIARTRLDVSASLVDFVFERHFADGNRGVLSVSSTSGAPGQLGMIAT